MRRGETVAARLAAFSAAVLDVVKRLPKDDTSPDGACEGGNCGWLQPRRGSLRNRLAGSVDPSICQPVVCIPSLAAISIRWFAVPRRSRDVTNHERDR